MNLNDFALWTAIITPFEEDGRIDFASFKHLLKRQAEAHNGVVLLGSTGEALALTMQEQKSLVEFACKQKLPIPLLVGVGGFQLPQILHWLDFCETQNIHGYLMPTPLYAKPGRIGQRQWFEALFKRVQKPCMLYNIPGRTGQELLLEAISPLAQHPQFWSLKEASGLVTKFHQYHQQLPGIKMLSGDDSLTYQLVPAGCSGLVSVAANIWPTQISRFVRRCLKQDLPKTEKKHLEQACDCLFIAPNPIPTKVLLHHKGEIKTPCLRLPLTHEEVTSLSPLLEVDQWMEQW